MASHTQQTSGLDKIKWFLSVAMLLGAGYGNAYYGEEFPALYRFIALLSLLAVVLFVISTTNHGRAFIALAKDARQEMRKVVWPKKNETLVTSGFVVLVVIFFSLVLWVVDSVLRTLISYILG